MLLVQFTLTGAVEVGAEVGVADAVGAEEAGVEVGAGAVIAAVTPTGITHTIPVTTVVTDGILPVLIHTTAIGELTHTTMVTQHLHPPSIS